jgi:multicomponent Na+:H+ antiporter subunit B
MRRLLIGLAIMAAALPMLAGVMALPRPGDPAAPVHERVAAYVVSHGPEETGADNLVTAVLLAYRGYDTFGEVMVMFAALAAVMTVLAPPPATRAPRGPEHAGEVHAGEVAISPVVAFVIHLLAPFIAAFAVLVVLRGEFSPGGGFQGGVILGALLVLLSVVTGRGHERPLLAPHVAPWLQAAAPLAFTLAALLGLATAGAVLGVPAEPAWARGAVMLGLELGIGIGTASIVLGLFLQMRGW